MELCNPKTNNLSPPNLRANLDYNEEVHQSKIEGEWSNMIGYKTGSSPAKVYTMAKTFMANIFKYGLKNNVVTNTFC